MSRSVPRVPGFLVLALVLSLPPRAAPAVTPPRPDMDDAAHRAVASMAAKRSVESRASEQAFRPLAPGETRHLKALVLLVDFSDHPATRPASDFGELFFSSGIRQGGSLRDFYEENSDGRLEVTGTVIGWLRAPHTYAYYVNGQSGFGAYPQDAARLVEDALVRARSRVRFGDFDNDGPDGVPHSGDDDGIVDAVVVVHSGPGAEESDSPLSHIWSHSSITLSEIPGDGASAFFYSITPEICELGVQCHEFGHLLGLPDLYDTTPPGAPDSYGLGKWSLMALGVWLGPKSAPGASPAHLDAWCKARLGFVDPVVPSSNVSDVEIAPVESGGNVYQLSPNGEGGTVTYLIENRRNGPGSFDRDLPGSGLLIYRIDATAADNDDVTHARVELMQADGRRDLEEGQNSGDDGDPFPGSAGIQGFQAEETPQVLVTAIAEGPTSMIHADLTVETRASFRVPSWRADASDAWPWPRWGETATLSLGVRNVGLASGAVTAALLVDDARVHADGPHTLGELPEDAAATADFSLTTDAIGPQATAEVPARLVLAHDGAADTVAVLLTVGRVFGLATSFETDAEIAGWTHGPVVAGRGDYWTLTGSRAFTGAEAFRFTGPRGTYEIDSDGALVSPPVLLGVDGRLTFRYWLSAEKENSADAYDGGRVELSENGGPWKPIEPDGGYPYAIDPMTPTGLDGARLYSGDTNGWRLASFDLSGVFGSVRVRFRFVSDQSVNREGWYIDDVAVTTRPFPFRVVLEAPVEEGDRVRVGWRVEEVLAPYDGAGFRLYRTNDRVPGTDPSQGYALVGKIAADSAGVFVREDLDATRGKLNSYLLEEDDASWTARAVYGPVSLFLASPGSGVEILAPFPNPYRAGALTVSYVVAGQSVVAGVVRASLYDVQGRRVRVLDERPATPGLTTFVWDGADAHARRVASGVYILRVTSPTGTATRRIVIVR